ncbi:MAG: trehalase family glycosidase [Phycisphaerae bacterium]|jgi:putative isomerase
MRQEDVTQQNRTPSDGTYQRLVERAIKTLQDNVLKPTSVEEGKWWWENHGKVLAKRMRPAEKFADPLPWHPRRGICPTPWVYRGIWNWDAAFHAVGAAWFDPALARDQVLIMLDLQQPSGALPDVVYENGEVNTQSGKPPVMPWAATVVDRLAPDDSFMREVYGKFVRYEEHWRLNRGGAAEGLFRYDSEMTEPVLRDKRSRFESGWDNSVRWDKASFGLWAIDLNCYMVMTYRALAYMAGRVGRASEAQSWEAAGEKLAAEINDRLWDESAGAYVDRFREGGAYSDVLSPASFMPLYIRIAPKDRAERMAALAADPSKFHPGMPTVAYDNPQYRNDFYWRGPTWLNVAYFALKGLKYYGYDAIADAGRDLILSWCDKNEDCIWELYDSRNGKGLRSPQFAWSAAFIITFVRNWSKGDTF